MLTDLRALTRVIQPMGPLEPGIEIDLNFTILLQEQDKEKIGFMVPTYNNVQPVKKTISGKFFH